ncbi:MAG: NMD3-related protein [Candidatus Anstonellales archaeon]
MHKICPKCGRSSSQAEFAGNFCTSCYPISFLPPDSVKIPLCKVCNKIKGRGWVPPTTHNIAEIIIKNSKGQASSFHFDKNTSSLIVSIHMSDAKIMRSYNVAVEYTRTTCPTCSKSLGHYHEAIIQLRGDPAKVQKYASIFKKQLAPITFVSREIKLKEGINLCVGSKRVTQSVIQASGLSYLRTEKIAGQRKDGKRLYRSTFRIRF